jgi:RNA polymerase sigma-70 factor (ECF subfamily)
MEPSESASSESDGREIGLVDTIADQNDSPFECYVHEEVRMKVEAELQQVQEPYRTTLILRDIEGLSYEEIADILKVSLGTVKSRLMRGREALRKRLLPYVQEVGKELGLKDVAAKSASTKKGAASEAPRASESRESKEAEVEIRR